MKQQIVLFGAITLFVLLGYFVWLTPYRYVVLPGVPPNPSNERDSGTPPVLLRISRVTGRVWILRRSDLLWFSTAERGEIEEYDEIKRRSSNEIKRRCDKAEKEGDFLDPKNYREIELQGYTFSCPLPGNQSQQQPTKPPLPPGYYDVDAPPKMSKPGER